MDEIRGSSDSATWVFATPRGDGKWTKKRGSVTFVDGYFHQIVIPGLETTAGVGFGVTATCHVVQDLWPDGAVQRGEIARHEFRNGRLVSAEVVASGVELVD
jgi:hypothetical protein